MAFGFLTREPRADATETTAVLEARIDQLSRDVALLREQLPDRPAAAHPVIAPDRFVAALSFEASEDFLGSNWHDPEFSGAGPGSWRWSGPGRLSSLLLLLDRQVNLRLTLDGVQFADGVAPILGLFIDGHGHGRQRIAGRTAAFEIPKRNDPSAMTEIGFLTGNTIQPVNADGRRTDDRWLGFQFREIAVAPVL